MNVYDKRGARSARDTASLQRDAVLFDIDGTLLDSTAIDDDLYLAAVRETLGEVRLRSHWAEYRHVTDHGILREILEDNELPGDEGLIEAVRDSFVASLGRYLQSSGELEEIPGARAFVRRLASDPSFSCAYATGGWGASARLKLASGGFPLELPLASSDDAPERAAILRHALDRLHQPGRPFRSITYFGDGEWDRRATEELGCRFIAVGEKLGGLRRYPRDPTELFERPD